MRLLGLIALRDRQAYPDPHQSAASTMANHTGAIAINRACGVAHAGSGFAVSIATGASSTGPGNAPGTGIS